MMIYYYLYTELHRFFVYITLLGHLHSTCNILFLLTWWPQAPSMSCHGLSNCLHNNKQQERILSQKIWHVLFAKCDDTLSSPRGIVTLPNSLCNLKSWWTIKFRIVKHLLALSCTLFPLITKKKKKRKAVYVKIIL